MKSITIDNPFEVEIIEEEIPRAGPGEIVVEAELSGISSGTEMFLCRGIYPSLKLKKWAQWREYPVRPGCELVGRVVKERPPGHSVNAAQSIGSLQPGAGIIVADTTEFKVGNRVVCLGAPQPVCQRAGPVSVFPSR